MSEPPGKFARRQIAARVEAAILASGVAGTFPTPLDAVATAAGIIEVVNIADLPDELHVAKPKFLRRILGAYLYRADTAFVDLSQPLGQKRFIQAHETGHKLIEWHKDSYHLDDEHRLFRDTEEKLELEANFAAALLIFQGRRFHQQALDYEDSIKTPILLADQFGASFHATIRFYVEHHPEPMALAIAGRFPRSDGTVPVFTSLESRSFKERFGPLSAHLPAVRVRAGQEDDALMALARTAIRGSGPVGDVLTFADLAGSPVPCDVEVFFNQRNLFVAATPRQRLRRGRRIRLAG